MDRWVGSGQDADDAFSVMRLPTEATRSQTAGALAQALDLLVHIQRRTGRNLSITHDLDVVRHVSHRVTVICRGEIVEWGDARQVTTAPEHPYTQRLWMASPVADPVAQEQRRADRRRLLQSRSEQNEHAGAVA